jgi:hypothetical protein
MREEEASDLGLNRKFRASTLAILPFCSLTDHMQEANMAVSLGWLLKSGKVH